MVLDGTAAMIPHRIGAEERNKEPVQDFIIKRRAPTMSKLVEIFAYGFGLENYEQRKEVILWVKSAIIAG